MVGAAFNKNSHQTVTHVVCYLYPQMPTDTCVTDMKNVFTFFLILVTFLTFLRRPDMVTERSIVMTVSVYMFVVFVQLSVCNLFVCPRSYLR